MKVAISAGHGKFVRGADGLIDEVDEARRVVTAVMEQWRLAGVTAIAFFDDTSRTQATNLRTITDWHNRQERDLDVSVHFDSNGSTPGPLGSSVLYISDSGKAAGQPVLAALLAQGFKSHSGMSYRPNLYFLKNTHKPAILIEVCFVNSLADVTLYEAKFDSICAAIAGAVAGKLPPPGPVPVVGAFHATGKCSTFGGPKDTGVASDEGLAFINSVNQAEHLFLPSQPPGTSGLARRLNPYVHYIACRWDYTKTSRIELLGKMALVRANGIELRAFPADWGPNEATGRVADLSPQLAEDLKVGTDDQVEVIFPMED